jgi:hypothetical protein
MPWAKHRIGRLQKIRSINGFDDRPECHPGGAAGPIARSRSQLPLPPDLLPRTRKKAPSFSEEKEAKRLSPFDAARPDVATSNV